MIKNRQNLIKILFESFFGSFDEQERVIFKEIKNFRKKFCQDSTKLNIIDLGAGNRFEINKKKFKTKTISTLCKTTSTSDFWGRVFFLVVKKFNKAKILELGTGLGFSSAYFLAAFPFLLHTVEGDKNIALYAEKFLQDLNFKNFKIFKSDFDAFLKKLEQNFVYNLVYIDGHHYSKAIFSYLDMLEKHLEKENLIIFDDILWSWDMFNFWLKVKKRCNKAKLIFNKGFCFNYGFKNY